VTEIHVDLVDPALRTQPRPVADTLTRRAATMGKGKTSPRQRVRANGEGTVSERKDGRWEARYFVREDGQWRRRSLYGKTKAEASRKLREALRNRGQGVPTPRGSATVGDFLAAWLDGVEPSLKLQSRRRYRQVVAQYLIPALGRRKLVDLSPEDLQAFYAERLAAGLSPATVRLAHFVLHRALSRALRSGKVSRNVADPDMVDLPRLPRQEPAHLDADQARRAIAAAQGDRLEALWTLGLTTGLRRGELLGLRWDAVDLDRGVVDVRYTLEPDASLGEPKSASSRRQVPVADFVVASLRQHKARQAAERLAAGNQWQEPVLPIIGGQPVTGGLVFTNPFGKPLPPMVLLRAWGLLLSRVGLPRMPFHAARHTAASLMAEAGIGPRVAAERLGHSSPNLTIGRYTHVSEGQRREAAEGVERLLGLSG
jgi:integrase